MRENNSREIQDFADELKNILDNEGSFVHREFDEETIKYLSQSQMVISLAGQIAREIEWLHNGAIKPATFKTRMKELEKRVGSDLA